eukprot:6176063-Pleurochrysis_carterae.AAC.2
MKATLPPKNRALSRPLTLTMCTHGLHEGRVQHSGCCARLGPFGLLGTAALGADHRAADFTECF